MSETLAIEVRALRAAVDALRDELQHTLRRLLSAEDRRDLKQLLPLIHDLLGSDAWSAASLKEAADQADAAELRDALGEWVSDSGGLRSFGRFLERCSDIACDGRRLIEAGRDRDGTLYVVRVSEASKLASAVAYPGVSAILHIPTNHPHDGGVDGHPTGSDAGRA